MKDQKANCETLVAKLTQEVMRRLKPGEEAEEAVVSTRLKFNDPSEVAKYISHTLLNPHVRAAHIKTL